MKVIIFDFFVPLCVVLSVGIRSLSGFLCFLVSILPCAEMGIKGLWKEVQPVCRAGHISQFRGMRVGVDTYCWLHRAVISCTMELATDRPCEKYLSFMMSRVDLLLRYGVTPVLVFDGDSMPMKRGTDAERKNKRSRALCEAQELLNQGAVEEALRLFEKSLEVTTEVAYSVIRVMQDRGIECIVAPYEADAQLGFLAKEGYISAVVSEDSDLIVYHCGILLAKMDNNGNCDTLYMRDLPNVPSLSSLSYESFVIGCILSGCDYLNSLPNVGIKTALKLAASAKSIPLLMNTLQLQFGHTQRELQPYEDALHKAYYCFAHHLVYDPIRECVVPFRPFPAQTDHRIELIGEKWSDELAKKICRDSVVDPSTRESYIGKHNANVELYWKKAKKGQTSLTSFSGFENMRSARVAVAMEPQDRRLQESPQVRAFSDTVQFGFCSDRTSPSALRQQPINRRLVVSKYFAQGRDRHLICESSGSESDEAATHDRQIDTEKEVSAVCDTPHPQYPLSAPSSQSQAMSPSSTTLCCPYGYSQCGRSHSVFVKCFQGKNWSKGSQQASSQEVSQPRVGPLQEKKRAREDTRTETNRRVTEHSLETLPATELTQSAPCHALKRDFRGVGLPPPQTTHSNGLSATTKAAVALFDQLAFRR